MKKIDSLPVRAMSAELLILCPVFVEPAIDQLVGHGFEVLIHEDMTELDTLSSSGCRRSSSPSLATCRRPDLWMRTRKKSGDAR